MTAKASKTEKVAPLGDNRERVYRSVKLWIVNRSWSEDKSKIMVCGVIGSIQRVVRRFEGSEESWILYNQEFFPLRSAEEFSELLTKAKKNEFEFFNNLVISGNAKNKTELAPFIFIN